MGNGSVFCKLKEKRKTSKALILHAYIRERQNIFGQFKKY